jgi:tetratricopeptide (TPR) repeat protein
VAVLVVIALGGVFYHLTHPRFKLTDKDTIVLADFENKTGDPVFDGSLVWALRIGLEQTPFLDVLASDKVSRVLTQAGHDAQEPLTLERAIEVCRRTNSRAVLIGTIADVGNHYGVALRAVRCETGSVVARSEATANERSQIVAKVGQTAVDLRGKLGEPNAATQQFNKPLDHATSASVETLKLYTEAVQRGSQKESEKTPVADMLQVTEMDPLFAISYRTLGIFYANVGEPSAMEDSLKKAFELRTQLTDRERLLTEGLYYQLVTGEIGRAIDVWDKLVHEYPSDRLPPNELAWCFRAIGECEQAAIAARDAIRVDPEWYNPYGNLMRAEIRMNRCAEAKAVYDEAHTRKIDSLHSLRFAIAFLERDQDGMQKELEWEKDNPSANGEQFISEADSQLYFGHAKAARMFLAKGVGKNLHAEFQESAAFDRCDFAAQEAEIGEAIRAREDAAFALAMSPSSREVKRCTSFVLALLGNGAEAQRMATEIKTEKPLGTIVNGLQVPTLMGAALLAERKPAEALRELEPSLPYFLSSYSEGVITGYLRGSALLKLNRAPEAVVEFRKIIDHPGLVLWSVLGPLARLQLARGQMMMGDKDAARKSYQDFLTLWEDADADIPIYKQAKAEYAKLR